MITSEPFHYLNPQDEGYFTIGYNPGKKFYQESLPLHQLSPCLSFSGWRGVDTYITQNTFNQPNRLKINLLKLTSSFVDLDTYKTAIGSLPPIRQAEAVLDYCCSIAIALPSIIIFSGQGLYAKWFFSQPVEAHLLPEWQLVENLLVDKFQSLGADPLAKDASRILRLPGTTNSKSKKLAKILFENKKYGKINRYAFDYLYQSLVPEDRKLKAFSSKIIDGVSFQPSLMRMNWLRVQDIIKHAKSRGYDVTGVPVGKRDSFLFVFSTCLAQSCLVPYQEFKKELLEIARLYCPSFTLSEIFGSVNPVLVRYAQLLNGEKNLYNGKLESPCYKLSNQEIIERLGIEPPEEEQMRVIISETEKKNRDSLRHKTRRMLKGMKPRSLISEKNKKLAEELHSQGCTKKQIAKDLKVSKRQVARYFKSEK